MLSKNLPLLEAAITWHQKGVPVLPFTLTWTEKKQEYEKRPVVETWKQWQDRPQTKEEFDALKIEEYTMFGVVCGTRLIVDGETVYLVGVDRDIKDPNLSEEVKRKTLQNRNGTAEPWSTNGYLTKRRIQFRKQQSNNDRRQR